MSDMPEVLDLRQDVRIEGYRAGMQTTWMKATHLPTGIQVEQESGTWDALTAKLRVAVEAKSKE